MSRTSVLVVGAGPTGLTLAIELASRGVAVRIIDRSPEHFAGSRGKGLAPRSREVFDNLGIVEEMDRSGWANLTHRRWVNGELVASEPQHDSADPLPGIPYPTGLLIAQWRVEEVLREKLATYGVHVELGSELTGFAQTADAVTATLASGAEIVADYLVGCDGGRSTIRKSVNATFEGESGPQGMLVGDVRVTGLEPDAWYMWTDTTKGFVALCPFRDWPGWQFQAARITDYDENGELPPPSIELFQDILDDIADAPGVTLSEPTWLSTYRVNVRMADRFRFDRVFLAGDAAHVHPPAGGLGMNTGIQDAHNLGWKLALVVSGKAGTALLDTYGAERVPIARWTLGVSTNELRVIADAMTADTNKERDGFRPRPELQQGQLALGYQWSPLAKTLVARPAGAPKAGDRAPDAPCQTATGAPLRLFDAFRQPGFTLLGFGADTTGTVDAVVAKHGDIAIGRLVDKAPKSTVDSVDKVDIVDVDGHAHREYAVTEPTLFLIRPDGHIGVIAAPAQGEAVLGYLANLGRN
jgi:2-polyprenyl-6-methoxyphenol hydroxylase-like FAD-dependent oxidoreductase